MTTCTPTVVPWCREPSSLSPRTVASTASVSAWTEEGASPSALGGSGCTPRPRIRPNPAVGAVDAASARQTREARKQGNGDDHVPLLGVLAGGRGPVKCTTSPASNATPV